MGKLRYGIESYWPSTDVVEAPDPVLHTLEDIGITSNAVVAGETIQTVNARKLLSFLQVGKQFSHWVQDRIDQHDFKENVDFVTFSQNGLKGRPSVEYHLSLNMAKELAMLERSPKSQARQYFIQCEKKLLQVTPAALAALESLLEALKMAVVLEGAEDRLRSPTRPASTH